MTGYVGSKVTLVASLGLAQSGLATVGYKLVNGDGSTFQARTTSGVTEAQAGSGIYKVELAASVFPAAFDGYVLWDTGGSTPVYASEDIYISAELAAIKARTDLLGSQLVSVVGPLVAAGRVEIIQGDDYADADGRALTWTDADAAWPDLTGHTVAFTIAGALEKTATVVDANTIRVELTAAETGALAVKAYDFSLVLTIAGAPPRTITLLEGLFAVDAPVNGP